ncbi:MAG TPA: glycosyltransferase [Pirellulales bacterium]|nr:glycosyltransferase [Pirellulales bacterium]
MIYSTTVIISTYNQPQSLRKCLLGFLAQTVRNFQLVVADDGSGPETAMLLQKREFAGLGIQHIWQPDLGWRRPRVLNLALAQIEADYCIFIDGDCIPRADFVEAHLSHRRANCYISGSKVNLDPHVHAQITDYDIRTNRVFDIEFLAALDPKLWKSRYRLQRSRWNGLFNLLTYRYRMLNGSNASAWREDILKVNGFDETFGYGSDDREFGMRLSNAGVKSRWLKFSLVQLHQGHRGNPNHEQIRRNRRRFRKLFFTRQSWVPDGIDTILERERERRVKAA